MPGPRRRTRVALVAAALVALLAAGAAFAAWQLVLSEPGSVSNPGVAFDAPSATPDERPDEPRRKAKRRRPFEWPLYGRRKEHRRAYHPQRQLRPPYRLVWRYRATALLEFPPVIYRGLLYQLADDGVLAAVNKETGKRVWRRKLGVLSASSPAASGGSVYVTLLERRKGTRRGRVVALKRRTGRIRWSRDLPSRSESSPLLASGRLYFGTEGGVLMKVNAHNGRTMWTYRADGAIKGSPTMVDGVLYFGDYGGSVHAVRASDGKRVWKTSPAARLVRSGRFYATAAVAFGRVYIGSTDGRQYSLSKRDGRLAWAHQTGNYVYSSAAIDNVEGLGPTVFFGSYDTYFYALNAQTGAVRWRHRSGGRISGSPTIIGDTVYFADLGRRRTIGLRTKGGRKVFDKGIGAFDPIISDGKHLFLTGRSSLSAYMPARRFERRERAERRRKQARRARNARWPHLCAAPAPCDALAYVIGGTATRRGAERRGKRS